MGRETVPLFYFSLRMLTEAMMTLMMATLTLYLFFKRKIKCALLKAHGG